MIVSLGTSGPYVNPDNIVYLESQGASGTKIWLLGTNWSSQGILFSSELIGDVIAAINSVKVPVTFSETISESSTATISPA